MSDRNHDHPYEGARKLNRDDLDRYRPQREALQRRLARQANENKTLGHDDWTADEMIICGPCCMEEAIEDGDLIVIDDEQAHSVVTRACFEKARATFVRWLQSEGLECSPRAIEAGAKIAASKMLASAAKEMRRAIDAGRGRETILLSGPAGHFAAHVNERGGTTVMLAEER